MPLVLCLRENEHPTLACSFMAPCSSHFGTRRLRASPTYPSASPHNRGRWYSTLGLVRSFPDIRHATLPLLLRSPPRHPRPDTPHPVPTPYHMLLTYPHHPPHTPSCRPRCIVFPSFSLPSSTLDSSPTTFSTEVSLHPAVTDTVRSRFSVGGNGRFCPSHRLFIHRPPSSTYVTPSGSTITDSSFLLSI